MERKAFTLIELIISVTIFTLILVTVYSTFNMGMKLWYRNQSVKSIQKIRLVFLKVEKELKDSFFFSKIPFNGTSSQMVFPIAISDEEKETILIITYSIDSDGDTGLKELIRKEEIFPESSEEERGPKRLVGLMKSIKFEYAYQGEDSSENFTWQENWQGLEQRSLPSGIRVTLETDETNDIYSKVVFLQQGVLGIR